MSEQYNNLMLIRHAVAIIGLAIALTIILVTTNPDTVKLGVLGFVFVLLYAIVFEIVVLAGLALRSFGVINWRQSRVLRVASGIAALPTFLLILQSIGQLTVRDVLLAGGLFVLLYFYFSRLAVTNS